MLSEIMSLISLMIAVVALLLTLWQNFLSRKALQAQSLLSLKQMENENFTVGLYAIHTLKQYKDYSEFLQTETDATQKAIYDTIDYLNFAARLAHERHIHRQIIWNNYFWAFRISREKLSPWWFEGQKENNFRRFTSYSKMSYQIAKLTEKEIEKFEKKHKHTWPSVFNWP